jgi:potassium-transporting ATPase KdpC subunit
MWSYIVPAFRMTLVLTILTGLIYPAVVTGIAQVIFPSQAHGSLVTSNGKVVGSALIGQNFSKPEYLHPRPSAAGQNGYDASASYASNYGATNQKLIDRVKASVEQYRKENPHYAGPIPADAVTTSASGLDPHISPANAAIQAARVARARNVEVSHVNALIAQSTEVPWLGFIGDPRVNVLKLNLSLNEHLPYERAR